MHFFQTNTPADASDEADADIFSPISRSPYTDSEEEEADHFHRRRNTVGVESLDRPLSIDKRVRHSRSASHFNKKPPVPPKKRNGLVKRMTTPITLSELPLPPPLPPPPPPKQKTKKWRPPVPTDTGTSLAVQLFLALEFARPSPLKCLRPNPLGRIHLAGAVMLRNRLLTDIRGRFGARMRQRACMDEQSSLAIYDLDDT